MFFSLLTIAVLVFLLWVTLQDFLYRKIYWWLCIVLTILFIAKPLLFFHNYRFLLLNWLVNIGIISIQLGVIYTYFSLRKIKIKNLIGAGDVLFMYTMAFALPTFGFIVGSCVTYIIALAAKLIAPKQFPTIPLAGWLALALFVAGVIELISQQSVWDFIYYNL